jgi:hypothetical protein
VGKELLELLNGECYYVLLANRGSAGCLNRQNDDFCVGFLVFSDGFRSA